MCTNRPTTNKWFDQYEALLQELKIESPMYIWNCNESGVQDVPKEKDVLGITGEKTNNVTSKETGGDQHNSHVCECSWCSLPTHCDT